MPFYQSRLLARKKIADDTVEFLFEKPADFSYQAGQNCMFMIDDAGTENKSDNRHTFSFVSAPQEQQLAIATRLRNSPFKQALYSLPDGAVIKLMGPSGQFVVQPSTKPLIFITGGIGITAVYSLIKHVLMEKSPRLIKLLYCNHSENMAAYTQELKALSAANRQFTFIPVYTEKQGRMDAALIKQEMAGFPAPLFYLSGPPSMMSQMQKHCIAIGVAAEQIITEAFIGY